MKSNNIQSQLYKLYILCIPFGTLIKFDWLGYGTSFSTILMLLGLILLILTGKFKIGRRIQCFIWLYLFMVLLSLIMSFVLDNSSMAYIESPFRAILGDVVLYGMVVCSIIYNWNCLSSIVDYRELYPIFTIQVIVLIVIGYIQLGVMLGIGPCLTLYSPLSKILGVVDSEYLILVNRGVVLFGTEPSSVAEVCFLTLPMLLSSVKERKGKNRIIFIILIALFSILLLLSGSTSVLACTLFVYVVLILARVGLKPGKVIMSLSFIIGLLVALLYTSSDSLFIMNIKTDSFEYKVIGKVLDRQNMSTAMRASTVINDMKIIRQYPITGVGNGNQGYFYNKNMPSWATASNEVRHRMSTASGISNGGGNFFPSYFSGYGLLGLIALAFFLTSFIKNYKSSILIDDNRMDLVFRIGISLFLVTSWISVGLKSNEAMCFLLALPCLVNNQFVKSNVYKK